MPASPDTDPGPNTRRRLLQAALKAFGQRDYDAVSTREIVEAAGANISAISYYFGGKQGLYLATAEFLAENIHLELQGDLERVREQMVDADPQQCRQLLGDLVGGLVGSMLAGEFGEDASGFIFREQSHPTDAFDSLYSKLFQPMHHTMVALVAKARGLSADSDEARLAAHALLGQVIVFRSSRTAMLRHLGRSAYTTHDLKLIQALIGSMITAALDYSPVGD